MLRDEPMDDELRDDEYSDESDYRDDDEDEAELVECSNCGAEIHEDSVQCPICGEYLTQSSGALAGRSLWFVLLGIAGVIAVVYVLLAGF